MRARIWSPSSRLLTGGGLLVFAAGLLYATVSLLDRTEHSDGAGIANVLALAPSVVGAIAAIYGLWARPRADDPAVVTAATRTLLIGVAEGEARTLAQLLGDTGEPRPADIGFVRVVAAVTRTRPDTVAAAPARLPTMPRWGTDGGAETGSLDDITAYHGTLDRGRLVVLGEGGAGKTVLALRLLLGLAHDARTAFDADPTAAIRIPVRLSLSTFTSADHADPAATRHEIDEWIARHIAATYGLHLVTARSLVVQDRVIPVLDGLDEMDPDGAPPHRAARVLAALNLPTRGAGPGPVVLTCRSAHHQLLVDGVEGVGGRLQDATAIGLRPLTVDQVVEWLTHRFPDTAEPDRIEPRWRRVVTTLRKSPSGRLAICLRSPLLLYMAITVYSHANTTPGALCELDATGLKRHLLDHLVPAVAEHHPKHDGTRYHPSDVERWLRTLADHLAHMAALGHSGTDLHLHQLWRSTGNPPGVIRFRVAAVVVSAYLLPVFGALFVAHLRGNPITLAALWPLVLIVCAPAAVLAFGLGRSNMKQPPRRLKFHVLRTVRGWRALATNVARGFALGSLLGAALGLAGWFADGKLAEHGAGSLVTWLTGAILLGSAPGIIAGLQETLSDDGQVATRPSDQVRSALIWTAGSSLSVVPAFALASGLIAGTVWAVTTGDIALAVSALVHGTVKGLQLGLGIGTTLLAVSFLAGFPRSRYSPWLRYWWTVRSLARRGRLPRHPGRFLDWAYGAGLVRMAGNATQFRHRDLQAHLGGGAATAEHRGRRPEAAATIRSPQNG